jgi:hypothetical protein
MVFENPKEEFPEETNFLPQNGVYFFPGSTCIRSPRSPQSSRIWILFAPNDLTLKTAVARWSKPGAVDAPGVGDVTMTVQGNPFAVDVNPVGQAQGHGPESSRMGSPRSHDSLCQVRRSPSPDGILVVVHALSANWTLGSME